MAILKKLLLFGSLAALSSAAPTTAMAKRVNYPNPFIGDAPSYAALPQPTGGEHMRTTPKVKSTAFTDKMVFFDASGKQIDVEADLGYSGVINGKSFWVFGDTFVGKTPNAVDSSGSGDLSRPAAMTIHMGSSTTVKQLITNTADEDATDKAAGGNMGFGGTNIVEVAQNKGVIYYEKIQRISMHDQRVSGAGVATVELNNDGTVKNLARSGETFWGKNEPSWGDIGATKDSTHVYLWGHGPASDGLNDYGFLARVPLSSYDDISSYEYFDNSTSSWSKSRMTSDGSMGCQKLGKEMAVWDKYDMFQAAPFWNAYYGCWMWLYGPATPVSDIQMATADNLQGPWTQHGTVAKTNNPEQGSIGDSYLYGINAHPEYDPTGKTTYVTWVLRNAVYGTIISWA